MLLSLALAACACPEPPGGYCPPAIRASDAVKADLVGLPLSGATLDWLDLIGKQQAAITANCGERK